MHRLLFLCFLAFALTASGCATLFSGSSDSITFNSQPSGARVMVDGLMVGTTPTTVSIKRPGFGDTDVTVALEGYDSRTFTLSSEFNTTSILNIFVPIGFVIDAVTGAITKHSKKSYNVDLEKGTVSLRLHELESDEQGRYVLPDVEGEFTVVDEELGLSIVFTE